MINSVHHYDCRLLLTLLVLFSPLVPCSVVSHDTIHELAAEEKEFVGQIALYAGTTPSTSSSFPSHLFHSLSNVSLYIRVQSLPNVSISLVADDFDHSTYREYAVLHPISSSQGSSAFSSPSSQHYPPFPLILLFEDGAGGGIGGERNGDGSMKRDSGTVSLSSFDRVLPSLLFVLLSLCLSVSMYVSLSVLCIYLCQSL